MRSRWSLVFLVPLVLVACGEPTLEPDDFNRSAQRLRASVDERDRPALDGALALVRQASTGEVPGTEPFDVDGMTAADVLAEGRRIELRREKAGIEEGIAARREILAETERLATLGPLSIEPSEENVLTMRIRNGLGEPVTTGWVRTTVELPDGRALTSEDFVSFGRALRPEEERAVQVQINGDARRYLPPPPEARLTATFMLVENAGTLVAKEPRPEEAARARAAIEAAERELAEVERRLREAR